MYVSSDNGEKIELRANSMQVVDIGLIFERNKKKDAKLM